MAEFAEQGHGLICGPVRHGRGNYSIKILTFPRKICREDLFLLSLDVRRISLQLVAFSKTLSFVFALNSLIIQRKKKLFGKNRVGT